MFKYERKKSPLLPVRKFYQRLAYNLFLASVIILLSLGIGIWGYVQLAGLNFTSALENAAMILGGMGPVDPMPNNASKYFASFYALFSGISFLSTIAILIAPVLHRAMHRFHIETDEDENKNRD